MAAQASTAETTRDRILSEAERLFRHFGYLKTTVADIADACGMSPANIYRYFGSKAEINEAICARIIAKLQAGLRVVASSGTASERLTRFIEHLSAHTRDTLINDRKVHDMVVVAMDQQWDVIEPHLRFIDEMVAEIIASGIASGEFRAQDPELAARSVVGAIIVCSHPVVVAQFGSNPTTPSATDMAAFVLAALRA
ncbi:transcriptional regulator, TetR family [Rhodomicrobium vannielii ATCC 17100]|jgi:AcrR family transcriptional regulator|uniref:Transcriptional regulator, TetR family n=1 Tax=Rhodomicrobium vannielii (strain ATCC 17100 / DSM 162 / LMG 4299 / NCIMB 10020 / ATH 3.1.1) TaxID=648757 RepID=E3I806_RHOVT|nr:TetR family transcriptional regulator [Rhodomicrobium vannielii]ADP71932.1 transcriptional regulator, TetR family [Rhodomicrobium vannielii ATCC 17100]